MKKTCRNCGNTECQQHTRCLMGWELSGMPSRAAIKRLLREADELIMTRLDLNDAVFLANAVIDVKEQMGMKTKVKK